MNTPGPLYGRVKSYVLERIHSGELPVGARIPSENALVDKLGVSRMTANRALRELAQEGHLVRVQGVGTFVCEPPHHSSLIEVRDIAADIVARGHRHSASVILREVVHADSAQADAFDTRTGAALAHVVVVHCENDTPVSLEDRYVACALVPDFAAETFASVTPTQFLLTRVPINEIEHSVRAITPTDAQCDALDIVPGEPCLRLYRRTWSSGRVVTIVTLIYPASRYELSSRYRTAGIARSAAVARSIPQT